MKKDEIVKLGQRIKKLRLALKMTQAELAEHCDLTESTIINYEVARRAPSADFLITLTRDFRVNPYWLLTGKGEFSFMKIDKFLVPYELDDELGPLITHLQIPVIKHAILAEYERCRIVHRLHILEYERDFFMT